MLSKCTNPSCSASFLHLSDGRLFRLETETRFPSPNARETEYFWLCESCSAEMTLRLIRDGTVATVRLADELCNGPYVPLNSMDRKNGEFLRSVSFLHMSHAKGT
jgi:hypothetical protein